MTLFQGGNIIWPIFQVAQNYSDSAAPGITSTSFVATNLSITITPRNTNHHLLIIAHASAAAFTYDGYLTLYRNSINLFDFTYGSVVVSTESPQLSGSTIAVPTIMQVLDTPHATPVTYTVYARTATSGGVLSYGGARSMITVIEFGYF